MHKQDNQLANGSNEPVYLCLESDNYKPDLMYTEPGISGYIQWRMCPPGRVKFFFITEGKATISQKYPIMDAKFNIKVNLSCYRYRSNWKMKCILMPTSALLK